jgi:hypothetical protein
MGFDPKIASIAGINAAIRHHLTQCDNIQPVDVFERLAPRGRPRNYRLIRDS